MSYILDALRKSEQERQRGKVPDFNSAPTLATGEPTKSSPWPMIAVALLSINLVVAVVYFMNRSDSSPAPAMAQAESPSAAVSGSLAQPTQITASSSSTPSQASTQLSNAPGNAPASAVQPAPSYEPPPRIALRESVYEPTPVVEPAQTTSQPVAEPTTKPIVKPKSQSAQTKPAASSPAPSVGYLPQLEELSPQQRQGIPDLTFSSHMYSSMPKYRSIIINGKRLKEGQFYNSDIQVREITESGVVMSQGNTLFEVDVLGQWAQ